MQPARTPRRASAPPKARGPRTPAPRPVGGPGGRLRRLFTWPVIKRVLKWGAISGLIAAAVVTAAVAITFWRYSSGLPSADTLRSYHPKEVTRIVVADGGREVVIGEIFAERRTVATFEELPPLLVDAFVVAEDAGFWEHGGIDFKGMIRAFFANLLAGKSKQGASTITQQVVKNLLLTPEKTFKRKMQEIILARRVEGTLTKEQILELYVNQIYFGHGRYGVVEAARFYFGKELDQLDAGEMAYLAGLPQAPEDISTIKNPRRAKERQIYVLNQLVAHGKLKVEDAQRFADRPLPVPPKRAPVEAHEVVAMVRAQLAQTHGEAKLDTLGADVRVTIRPDVQAAARAALRARLREYDEERKVARPIRKVGADGVAKEIARLERKRGGAPKAGELYDAVVTAVHDADAEVEVDLGGWPAAIVLAGDDEDRFNAPDDKGARRKPSQRFAVGDVVEVVVPRGLGGAAAAAAPKHGGGRAVRFAPGPEGAVVVIDVTTREVLALVGGFDVRPGAFNRAIQAKRQPGSSFKPFVYAAALASGRYTAATIVNDAPDVYDLWKPKNYGKCCEGPVRLRHALAKSINTVAIRVAHDVGPAQVAALAHAMGIESELPEHLSLSLGSGEVTPLELTNAFATFAAGGVHQPPRLIHAVDGKLTPEGATTQALSPQIAYVITDMMRSVVTEGTATSAGKALRFPVAGKTGTSNDERDAWFVGVTDRYAIGVWVGHDDNRPLGAKQTGGAVSVPVFVDVVKALLGTGKGKPFDRPPGIVDVRIDKATGLLAADGAPAGSTLVEVFVEGTAPREVAPLPGEVSTDTFVTDAYGDDPMPEETEPEPPPAPARRATGPEGKPEDGEAEPRKRP